MEHENYIILYNKIMGSIKLEYFKDGQTNNNWKLNEHNGYMMSYLRVGHKLEAEELRITYAPDNYIRLIYMRGELFEPSTTCYDINVDMMVFYRHFPELIGCNDDYCMRKVFHNMAMESALGQLE